MKTTTKFAVVALFVIAAFAWAVRPGSAAPASDGAASHDAQINEAIAVRTSVAAPAVESAVVAARTSQPWIEAGTPAQFHRPYLREFTPVAIYRDGRQVYEGVSMTVRNPDGSTRSVPTRIELEPAPVAPLVPSETGATAR